MMKICSSAKTQKIFLNANWNTHSMKETTVVRNENENEMEKDQNRKKCFYFYFETCVAYHLLSSHFDYFNASFA